MAPLRSNSNPQKVKRTATSSSTNTSSTKIENSSKDPVTNQPEPQTNEAPKVLKLLIAEDGRTYFKIQYHNEKPTAMWVGTYLTDWEWPSVIPEGLGLGSKDLKEPSVKYPETKEDQPKSQPNGPPPEVLKLLINEEGRACFLVQRNGKKPTTMWADLYLLTWNWPSEIPRGVGVVGKNKV